MSPACDQIAAALSKAQAAMQAAKKDSANPHFGSRYSSLVEVWDAIREPLTRQGLSVVQLPSATGAASRLTQADNQQPHRRETRINIRCCTMFNRVVQYAP